MSRGQLAAVLAAIPDEHREFFELLAQATTAPRRPAVAADGPAAVERRAKGEPDAPMFPTVTGGELDDSNMRRSSHGQRRRRACRR